MDLERNGKMPVPIGIFDVHNMHFEGLPLQTMARTQSQNLVAVAEDYDLAVLQLPFLVIPFESSLLGVYMAETHRQLNPQLLVSPRIPFVVGLEIVLGMKARGWDHKIVLVDKGEGKPLVDWLSTVAFNDTVDCVGYRIRNQTCIISDVFEFEWHTQEFKVPLLEVPVLCVETTKDCYYFTHKQKVGLTYPVLKREELVLPDFDDFLSRLRAGERDLYGVADALRDKAEQGPSPNLLHRRNIDEDGGHLDGRENKPRW